MQVQPYLMFNGRCEEALEFYKKAIDAKITMLMRFKDAPEKSPDCATPGDDKVMHASLQIGDSTVMATDGQPGCPSGFQGFSLTLSVADEAEARRRFAALSDGGQVHMPLTKTFFSPSFGMLADRFGVSWMVILVSEGPGAPH